MEEIEKEKQISKTKLDCIIKIVDKWLDYQQFIKRTPGLSAGIVYKNKIIFSRGYGYSNIERKEKATKDTLYRIASISKIFTSIAIMQLVESKKIQLDDSISKYLLWANNNKITIRQLLTHSSGIDRDGNTSHWIDDHFPYIEEVKKHVKEGAIIYSPIEKFKYSNLGFTLLGSIIEIISGKTYSDYIEENILNRLKLIDTYADITEKAESKLTSGYGRDIPGIKRENFGNPSTKSMASATGFISNTLDLCKFISAQFLSTNQLLNKESKKEMQRVQWIEENKEEIRWGIGYEIWKVDETIIRGHGGGFPGFITRMGFDREKELGVVVLTNCLGGNAHELVDGVFHIINYVLKNWDNFKAIEDKTIDLSKYEERFSNRWGDIQFIDINGSLNYFSPESDLPFNEIKKLKHLNKNTFVIEAGENFDYIGEKTIFEFDKSGNISEVKIGASTLVTFKEFIQNMQNQQN